MSLRPRSLAWILATVWLVWVAALQANLQGSWALLLPVALPDLFTMLLVCLATSFSRKSLLPLAILATIARKCFSIDPPVVILFASLCIVALAGALRSVIELRGALWRSLFAGLCATLFPLWLGLARELRSGVSFQLDWWQGLLQLVVALGFAFFLGFLFSNLPGLAPLERERWST